MIRWFMVLEIWCVFDIFISLFRLFFALLPLKQPYQWNFSKNKKSTWIYDQFTYVHQKLLWDDLQFLRYGGWKMELLILIWGYLLPFYLSNSLKNKNLKKWKKKKKKRKTGDIIILHICTKIYCQMIYGSWDIGRDRWNYEFSF